MSYVISHMEDWMIYNEKEVEMIEKIVYLSCNHHDAHFSNGLPIIVKYFHRKKQIA